MGDCRETQDVDPIFFQTQCGSFMTEVAEECCSNFTVEGRNIGILNGWSFEYRASFKW